MTCGKSQTRPIKEENTGNESQSLMMSPNGYIQLLLLGLLCTGVIGTESSKCKNPEAQSNVDLNQVYGEWFLGKARNPINQDKNLCFPMSFKEINETTLEASASFPGIPVRNIFKIENTENAGTWGIGGNYTLQVIYLSADGTTMAIAGCLPMNSEPHGLLISKQLPITSEKIEEVRLAVEQAGMSMHDIFPWESEATCPSD